MHAAKDDTRFRLAGVGVLLAVLLCWLALSITAVLRQGTWNDETGYIIKSWWYVSGAVKPYSAEDATWYQPLIFYVLGAWQWLFGHGMVSARVCSLVITGVNIGLLAGLLYRLGCTVWPIAFAIVAFVLSENGIFYFNSATPFSAVVCVQLLTLHLLLQMKNKAGFALAIAFGCVLTMIYLLRINLVFFIAIALAAAWIRAGADRWRVYFCSAAIFLATWSLLATVWGRQFVYVSLWLPGLTDWLVRVGVLPKLYPLLNSLTSQMLIEQRATLLDRLDYAFGWEMIRDWILGHHIVPIGAALFATVLAVTCRVANRGWILLLVASYWTLLLVHHWGAQTYCPICIQAYANFFDYLAALAGGLSLHAVMQRWPAGWFAPSVAVLAIVVSLGAAANQSQNLTRVFNLLSFRNRGDSLPSEVRSAGEVAKTLLPAGSTVEFVGRDPRIPLALADADIRLRPTMLSLTSFYRKLNDNLTPEQTAQVTEEIRDLSGWTDGIAKEWIQDKGDWMIVQRQPVPSPVPWLIWSPETPFIKTALANCFEEVAEKSFAAFEPPLAFALYRRTARGKVCLGE